MPGSAVRRVQAHAGFLQTLPEAAQALSVEDRIWKNQVKRARFELRRAGVPVPQHARDLFGCDKARYISCLKDQARKGRIEWDDYGFSWHVDHVIPLAAWDLKRQANIEKAFGVGNIQPLSVRENLAKGCAFAPPRKNT